MKKARRLGLRGAVRGLLRALLLILLGFHALVLLGLLYLRFLPPLTTAVQAQRRVEALLSGEEYRKRYRFLPLERISDNLEHAVVSAEDQRFFQHGGFDWNELGNALSDALEGGRVRGASTISQQLVKNLFLSTGGSFVRKGLELTLTPMAELVLGKQRILELYLNVIEWGPGVYGAEAAAQHWYDVPAAELGRERSARLAAILPNPRTRQPRQMGTYSREILRRMRRMGR
jgi:monofunctional biosynthetic peptidoglycan transglycosylase